MKSKVSRQRRKIKGLILISAFSAIILSVSTYAWFIGMQKVNV